MEFLCTLAEILQTRHPKILAYCLLASSALPKQYSSLLWKFIVRPDAYSKAHRKIFMF
jgi:hypothetical protein